MKKRANIQIALTLGFLLLNFVLFFVTKKVAYIPLILIPLMVISVFIWSRGFCGWACPRAAFLERFMKHFSLNKPVPKWMQGLWVSAFIFIVLISRVTYVGLKLKRTVAQAVVPVIKPVSWALKWANYRNTHISTSRTALNVDYVSLRVPPVHLSYPKILWSLLRRSPKKMLCNNIKLEILYKSWPSGQLSSVSSSAMG